MAKGDLERLFDRFRDEGDLAALSEVFDRTAPELMRVATHLSGNLDEAEDWVQATFLAAIEGGSGFDAERRLLPWLLGILARKAARTRRERARLLDASKLARETPTSPVSELERAELQGALESALAELPETYRGVLRAHLVDGRRANEIARELERAPGTVRMQIHRGLDLLRRALPTGLASGGWLGLGEVRGFEALKTALLERAASLGPTAAAPLAEAQPVWGTPGTAQITPLSTLSVGAGLMAAKLGLVACVFVLAAAGIWMVGRPAPLALPAAEATENRVGLVAPPSAHDPLEEEPAITSERRATLAEPNPKEPDTETPAAREAQGGIFLVGSVLGLEEELEESPYLFAHCFEVDGVRATRPDADGAYELDVTSFFEASTSSTVELVLSANHPNYLAGNTIVRAEIVPGELAEAERREIHHDFRLEPGAQLDGRVELPSGCAPDTVEVGLFRHGEHGAPESHPVRVAELEEGRYHFEKRLPGRYWVVARAPGLAPAALDLELLAGRVHEADPLLLSAGEIELRGRLVLPLELSPEGAEITATTQVEAGGNGGEELGLGLSWSGRAFASRSQSARVATDGGFVLRGLAPGAQRLNLTELPGHTLFGELALDVEAPAEGILFRPSARRLQIQVEDEGGLALAGATVALHEPEGSLETVTDANGHALVLAAPWSIERVGVDHDDFLAQERELVTRGAGTDEELLFTLARGDELATLELELPPDAPPTLKGLRVTLTAEDGRQDEHDLVVQEGSVEALRIQPGDYRLTVEPDEARMGPFYVSFVRLEPLSAQLEAGRTTRIPLSISLGGRLRIEPFGIPEELGFAALCELTDSAGRLFEVRYVTRVYEDNVIRIGALTGALPTNIPADAYPNLPAGDYVLRVTAEDYRDLELSFAIVAGETTRLPVPFRRE